LLVFIDESGDPGFDIEHGSTPLFVVTAVIFRTEAAASACRDRIRAVRAELGLPAAVEFKFSKTSNRVRDYFLAAVATQDFFSILAVFDKKKLAVPDLRIKNAFYQYVTGFVYELLKTTRR
jgi:hypothetical protein